jgi:hypothetical protein
VFNPQVIKDAINIADLNRLGVVPAAFGGSFALTLRLSFFYTCYCDPVVRGGTVLSLQWLRFADTDNFRGSAS